MDAFERFAIVEDVSDHIFFSSAETKNNFIAGSQTYKKIMREWKLLQQSLPNSIFVRSYESRIDLLRAVIIGAAGTPYHDGLFFFDIAFPPQYPSKPPKIHFRSYGLRINPNLYDSGLVCLSLLNTWYGSKKERWNPSESTILQVLLSIQALILNEKPFYNEPGVGNFSWTKKMSQIYNERVFISSCKMMIFSQRNPPKNFEAIVAVHFRNRAVAVLTACEAYTNGRVLVGCFNDESKDSAMAAVRISKEFRRDMAALYPALLSWFRHSGASVENSIQELKLEKLKPPLKTGENKGVKSIFKKVMKKVKAILGLKKKNDQKMESVETKAN